METPNNDTESPVLICETISCRSLVVNFLKATKNWDHNLITKEYTIAAKDVMAVNRLVNNLRVYISRIRSNYRSSGKPVPQFTFTSQISQLTTEPDEEGYFQFKVVLGKSNSPTTQNKILIEELL